VSKEFGGVFCFEMEAAGLMNSFPYLVIRDLHTVVDRAMPDSLRNHVFFHPDIDPSQMNEPGYLPPPLARV
jgi:hypothetical protein